MVESESNIMKWIDYNSFTKYDDWTPDDKTKVRAICIWKVYIWIETKHRQITFGYNHWIGEKYEDVRT